MGASKTLKQAQGTQQSLVNQSLDLSHKQGINADQNLAQRTELNKYPIDFYTSLASGDPAKMLTAAAVPLSNIAKQAQSAKGAIQDQLPAGATRQFALAQLEKDKYGKNADFLNQAYLSSFPALQGIAKDSGDMALQQTGAQFRAIEGAGNENQAVIQSETQRQAAKMGMIGQLAGVAGGVATGSLTGGLGGIFKSAGAHTLQFPK